MTLGAAYLTAMTCGAMGQRVPREGWKPAGWEPSEQKDAMISTKSVHYNTALKTPQCVFMPACVGAPRLFHVWAAWGINRIPAHVIKSVRQPDTRP
jgi:hypothetical protein